MKILISVCFFRGLLALLVIFVVKNISFKLGIEPVTQSYTISNNIVGDVVLNCCDTASNKLIKSFEILKTAFVCVNSSYLFRDYSRRLK